MWEYLSTYSKTADNNTVSYFKFYIILLILIYLKATTGTNKLYYRADFAEYMVSLGERSAAVGFVSYSNDCKIKTNYCLY